MPVRAHVRNYAPPFLLFFSLYFYFIYFSLNSTQQQNRAERCNLLGVTHSVVPRLSNSINNNKKPILTNLLAFCVKYDFTIVQHCFSRSLRHSSRFRKSIEEAIERIRMKFDRAHTNYTNILRVCVPRVSHCFRRRRRRSDSSWNFRHRLFFLALKSKVASSVRLSVRPSVRPPATSFKSQSEYPGLRDERVSFR